LKSSQPKLPAQLTLFGIANYLPQRPEGETDNTIEAVVNKMKQEHKKLKQNRMRIGEMMDVTFADRRKMVVEDKAAVEDIQLRFPCLFSEDEVYFPML